MIGKGSFDRRQIFQLGASAAASLAITPEAIAQAPTGGPPKPFNLATTTGISGAAFIDVMKQKGYLEKYGLATNFVPISDGTKILSAVLTGDVDMVRAAGFGQVLTAIEKGGAVKLICGAGALIIQAIYTTRPDIRTLKDLEGRIVGTGQQGALLHEMTVALLRKNGVDVDKVRFVNVGSSADVFRSVVAGVVDAGPGENDVHGEQAKWGVHSIAEFWNELPEYPYQAGFTSDRTIAEKRDTIVCALAAFGELYRFLRSPDSLDMFIKAYKTAGRDEATARYQWDFMQKYKPYSLNIPEASIDYLQNLNLELGIQKVKMPLDKVADLSMAKEALKMIGS